MTLLFLMLGAAHADDQPLELIIPEVTEIDFKDGVGVKGRLIGPDGKIISEPKGLTFTPNLHLREQFDLEMLASLREVK